MGCDIREYKSCDAVNQFFRQYHYLLLLNAKLRKKISNLHNYFCCKRISVSQSCQSINELRGKLRFHQNGENMGYPSEKPLFTNDRRQHHRQLSPQLYDEAMKRTDFHI